MKFDSNRSWVEALADIRANRDLLLTVGAFFFFLPTLVSLVLTAQLQVQMSESMKDAASITRFFGERGGPLVAAMLGELLFNCFGMLTLLSLLSRERRLTVGQALMSALQGLPGLIGLSAIYMLTFLAVLLFVSMTLGSVLILALGPQVGGFVTAVVALIVGGLYPAARYSMALPALVLEGKVNPLHAAVWSWRTTKGNGIALALFFFLLTMAFAMVSLVAMLLFGPLLLVVAGQGLAFYLLAGVLNGLVTLAKWIILTAIIYRTYRQLAGEGRGVAR